MDATTARRALLVSLVVAAALAGAPSALAYGWPIKPFDRQHAVRAYFGDPRIGSDGHGGISHSLHFGIDISAPNGTSVYSISSGRISLHPLHPTDVVLVQSGGVTYEYWHVVPAVHSGYAVAYKTIVGRIEAPWAHVHFAERRGSTYVNPLRPGALAPYRDSTTPVVSSVRVTPDRAGGVDLEAEAFDTTPVAVAAPWNDKPVTPALVEWRLYRKGSAASAWSTAADFRDTLPRCSFDAVYDSGTSQNHASTDGDYRFVLARNWRGTGTYVLQVRVSDTAGNSATKSAIFTEGQK
jgi:hypothetical protein